MAEGLRTAVTSEAVAGPVKSAVPEAEAEPLIKQVKAPLLLGSAVFTISVVFRGFIAFRVFFSLACATDNVFSIFAAVDEPACKDIFLFLKMY